MSGIKARMGFTSVVAALCLFGAACSDQAGETKLDPRTPTLRALRQRPALRTKIWPSSRAIFNVGGHKLYMRCSGTGSPTVVYLHGYIEDPSFSGSSSALTIQSLLEDRHRTCVYDRANVGESESVRGLLDGKSSVADLHRLLDAVGIDPPYVLLAASFGGLIAHLYSATYPGEVVGMVYLDSSLPADVAEIDKRFDPGAEPPDWRGTVEQIDEWATYSQAYALEGDAPKIPLTYLASNDLPPEPKIAKAVREGQREYTAMFSPGGFIELDVPHYMEPEIPQRIAEEVERVIAQT